MRKMDGRLRPPPACLPAGGALGARVPTHVQPPGGHAVPGWAGRGPPCGRRAGRPQLRDPCHLTAAPHPPLLPRCPAPAEEAKEAEEEAPAAAEYDATFGAAQALPGTEAAFDEYG